MRKTFPPNDKGVDSNRKGHVDLPPLFKNCLNYFNKCHLIWEEKEKVTDEKWKSSREYKVTNGENV